MMKDECSVFCPLLIDNGAQTQLSQRAPAGEIALQIRSMYGTGCTRLTCDSQEASLRVGDAMQRAEHRASFFLGAAKSSIAA